MFSEPDEGDHPSDKGVGRLPVTVIVITKNEAIGIGACLRSLKVFNEVIVVDSESDDGTQRLAEQAGATVVNFRWNGRYPKKKQWCLDNVETSNRWVLLLDADEQPTSRFVEELRSRRNELDGDRYAAYDVPLEYVFMGRSLEHGHKVIKRVLLRIGRVQFPPLEDLDAPGGIPELELHYQPTADGPVGKFIGPIRHDDRDPVSTWFTRHNGYSDWEAFLRTRPVLRNEIVGLRSKQGRLFARVPGKPLLFFLYSYIARRGFRDGRAGLDYALALSFYYWQISLKVRESRVSERREFDDRMGRP
jgi:glycosyltransferase involved in cell wall biosynthesis